MFASAWERCERVPASRRRDSHAGSRDRDQCGCLHHVNAALFEGWPLVTGTIASCRSRRARAFLMRISWRGVRRRSRSKARWLFSAALSILSRMARACRRAYFATEVTSNIFQVLGVRPILGGTFCRPTKQTGAEPVMILRYEVWVGRSVRIPQSLAILCGSTARRPESIGVMPKGFSFPYPIVQNLWTPHDADPGCPRSGETVLTPIRVRATVRTAQRRKRPRGNGNHRTAAGERLSGTNQASLPW